jgi:hypothetical protein
MNLDFPVSQIAPLETCVDLVATGDVVAQNRLWNMDQQPVFA